MIISTQKHLHGLHGRSRIFWRGGGWWAAFWYDKQKQKRDPHFPLQWTDKERRIWFSSGSPIYGHINDWNKVITYMHVCKLCICREACAPSPPPPPHLTQSTIGVVLSCIHMVHKLHTYGNMQGSTLAVVQWPGASRKSMSGHQKLRKKHQNLVAWSGHQKLYFGPPKIENKCI